MSPVAFAESQANSNIALIKYWGKLDRPGNYPAVPSLSLTLSDLTTTTRVELDARLKADEVHLDGELAAGRTRDRVIRILEHFRHGSGSPHFARVTTNNDFPTAAGLASSASGFAALVTAANAAYATHLSRAELSSLARSASASAARSLFEGWSMLAVGADSAVELAPACHWQLVLLVVVTATGKKSIGSTEAMNLTRETSPFYGTWVEQAPRLFEAGRAAVLERDLPRLGAAMEQSTLMMHATMMSANPAVIYLAPGTLNVLHQVTALRARGLACYYTMDAGPHVKVLCEATTAARIRDELAGVDGVREVILAHPGPAARLRLQT